MLPKTIDQKGVGKDETSKPNEEKQFRLIDFPGSVQCYNPHLAAAILADVATRWKLA